MSQYKIKIKGEELDSRVKVEYVECFHGVNQLPKLTLKVTDGDPLKGTFDHADSVFTPGQSISLEAGFGGQKPVFNGTIYERSIGIDGTTYTKVVAYGDVVKLTEGRETQAIKLAKDQGDIELFEKLGDLRGVKITLSETLSETLKKDKQRKITFPHYFLYQQTPWRALMARVLANGYLLAPQVDKTEVLAHQYLTTSPIEIGIRNSGVKSFYIEHDERSQIKQVSSQYWNLEGEAKTFTQGIEKDVHPKSDVIASIAALQLNSGVPYSQAEAEARAEAEQIYRNLDRFKGKIVFYPTQNRACKEITLLSKLKLTEYGKAYSGEYLVTGVEHRFSPEGWHIVATLGLHLNYTLLSDWWHVPAIPLLSGVVQKDDKASELEYAVNLSGLSGENNVFARLAQPFASNNASLFFPPNPGDEVLLEFLGGDCRHPVIVGSMHNSKNILPAHFSSKTDEQMVGLHLAQPDMGITLDLTKDKESMFIKAGKETQINANDQDGVALSYKKSRLTLADNVAVKTKEMVVEVESKMEVK